MRQTASSPPKTKAVALAVKRVLDVSLAVALAMITLPLMVVITAAILCDSPGPVLFRATRVGRGGQPFGMLKFRTMVPDAEERLQEIAHLNVAQGMVKIPDDPRVTRTGRWLRRYSLDELPQVFNVLVGHMSLVGPRPHDVDEIPPAALDDDPRLTMRPGLTGLWQVSARSNPSLDHRIYYDTTYVKAWSLAMDARILARTVPVVVRGTGGLVRHLDVSSASGKTGGGFAFEANSEPTAPVSQSS